MKTKTQLILAFMNVLSWIAFVGLMIQAGAILTSYVVSIIYPEGIKKLYLDLQLDDLRQSGSWHYHLSVLFMFALEVLKAYIAYLVITVLSRIRLSHPFTPLVSKLLERISYVIIGTWIVAVLNNAHIQYLLETTGEVFGSEVPGEFVFVAGLVFIISQIFRRGVEIQSENDLTV